MEMKKIYKELQIKKIEEGLLFSRSHKLGFGAFGEVYLGFDQNNHTPFAVKVVNLEKIMTNQNQEGLIKKIKDEIVNMQIAKNQHIVQFQQAKSSARNIYIVCEYCNGDNLDKFIHKRGYLTQTQALSIFKEILQGFYQLHNRNIVHRDIKPANLLLHNYSIKIADLGFSKSTEGHQQLLESIVGSPMYMSPQIFEREKYTQKTDIWSLGVILYEMLYGSSPWAESRNLLQLKEKIRKQVVFPKYPFVTSITKDCIKRMLVVNEKDRINWEILFHHYLIYKPPQLEFEFKTKQYVLNPAIEQYFRKSYFIESNLHLHKQMKILNLLNEQQLADLSPKYNSTEQFFNEVRFLTSNKDLIEQYYAFYLQRRNQISFAFVLLSKISVLMHDLQDLQLQTYLSCVILLIFKLAIAILEQVVQNNQLVLPQQKFKEVQNKFCHDKFITIILLKDHQIITEQFAKFTIFFNQLINYLPQVNPSLLSIVQRDLSGIYGTQQGDLRVIRFFLSNYFKKTFNSLRQIVLKQKKIATEEKMVAEEQESNPVSVEFTIIRMINQYLKNEKLFSLKSEDNQKMGNIAKWKKNLNQFLYDCETSMEQSFYTQLEQTQPLKQESVMTFLSKEIKWTPLLLPRFI